MLEADYLILGAGAMSMSFADVILREDANASIVMVDRRAAPGGHWNDAYPYVRLHQPAAFYGVNSAKLGRGGSDLVSGGEILDYYARTMDRFQADGRLRFLASTEHRGSGGLVSLEHPDRVTRVTAARRVVDGTYMHVQVPATRAPQYSVDDEATLRAPNGLVDDDGGRALYVVIGAGKTGIDAILFLLDRGVPPERVRWVMPNDAWLWDRATVQPGGCLSTIETFVECLYGTDDPFSSLEARGVVCRLDERRRPTRWRCATVDRDELARLRTVEDVVRLGRVRNVHPDRLELDDGVVACPEDTLFVDCTADGLAKRPRLPVFADGRVTLQPVFMCQQTFSAAAVAHLELSAISDARRNRICAPVAHPERDEDLGPILSTSIQNMLNLNRHSPLWLRRSRLFNAHHEPLVRYVAGCARITRLQRRARRRQAALA